MGYVLLVIGLEEFLDWVFGGKGWLGGLIFKYLHLDFPLFCNPFIALYLTLPAAWSELLRHQVRDGLLSRWQLLFHPWARRLSPWCQGLCYALLAHQGKTILVYLGEGKAFTPNRAFFLFSSILLLVFSIQLLLRNLPEVAQLPGKILPVNTVGLYAIEHDRFVLEETPGVTAVLKLIEGPRRWFKEKSTEWFVFARGVCDLSQTALDLQLGVLQVQYSYWAMVTDNPGGIKLEKVSLTSLESPSHLPQWIDKEFTNQLRQFVTTNLHYKELEQLVKSLFEQGQCLAFTIDGFSNNITKTSLIRLEVDRLQNELLNTTEKRSIYGGLYELEFQLNRVNLADELTHRLDRFESQQKDLFSEWYQRHQDERKFGLDLAETVGDAIGNWQGVASRPTLDRILQALMLTMNKHLVPESMQEEVIAKVTQTIPSISEDNPFV